MSKKYADLHEHLRAFYNLVGLRTFFLEGSTLAGYVSSRTEKAYKDACKDIRAGTKTVQDILDMYPLDYEHTSGGI